MVADSIELRGAGGQVGADFVELVSCFGLAGFGHALLHGFVEQCAIAAEGEEDDVLHAVFGRVIVRGRAFGACLDFLRDGLLQDDFPHAFRASAGGGQGEVVLAGCQGEEGGQ